MSLINEALKRAEQDGPGQGTAPGRPGPKRPAGPGNQDPQKRRTSLGKVFLLGMVVIACVASLTYLSLPPEQKPVPSPSTGSQSPPAKPAEPAPAAGAENAVASDQVPEPTVEPPQPQLPLRLPEQLPVDAAPAASLLMQLAKQEPPRSRPPAPGAPSGDPASEFKLGGIMRSNGAGHAIVNGRMVSVGDMVDGARVVSIEKYHVVLEKAGTQFELRM